MILLFLLHSLLAKPYLSLDPIKYQEAIVVLQQAQGLPVSHDVVRTIPQMIDHAEKPPMLTASAGLIVDDRSNTVLFSTHPEKKIPLASLTKLATVMTYLDLGIDPETRVIIREDDDIDERSGLHAGDNVSSHDLVMLALVGSSNSAAHALMTSSGLPQDYFIRRMNTTAQTLGLVNTTFVEPTGLSPHNIGTAYDVYRLLKAARELPIFLQSAGLSSYEYTVSEGETKKITATDALVTGKVPFRGDTIIAAKTGYIPESGFHVALSARDKQGNNRTVVILGADDSLARFSEADALLFWASHAFSTQ